MLNDRQNRDAMVNAVASRLRNLHMVLDLLDEIPIESSIEIQHALTHWANSKSISFTEYASQTRQFSQINAHFDRALLDACKKYVIMYLYKIDDVNFVRKWFDVRQKEFTHHGQMGSSPIPDPVSHAFNCYYKSFFSGMNQAATPVLVQNDKFKSRWHDYASALDVCLREELVFTCFSNKKSPRFLFWLVRSLWKLDVTIITKLTWQMRMETIIRAIGLAKAHGYPQSLKNMLMDKKKSTDAYLKKIENVQSNEDSLIDVQTDHAWITEIWTVLSEFYGFGKYIKSELLT